VALKTALGQRHAASSAPTLCRFDNAMERPVAVALHEVLVDHFIQRQGAAPSELMLDLDATDDPVHGDPDRDSSSSPPRDWHRAAKPRTVLCPARDKQWGLGESCPRKRKIQDVVPSHPKKTRPTPQTIANAKVGDL